MAKEQLPCTYDIAVKIVGEFEGTGYGSVSGNFDGMGISAGILQWNLGSGTLQDNILSYCDVTQHNFPVCIKPLQTLKKSDAVAWAKDVMHDSRGKLKQEWAIAWKMFMTSPVVVNLQKRAIDKYWHRAREICGQLGFPQEYPRAMVFAFDIAVQNWSYDIGRPALNYEQAGNIIQLYGSKNFALWNAETVNQDQQIMLIAAHLRALKCKPEWRHAVFVRKATIAIGIGYVNGVTMDFRKLFKR